MRGPGTSLNTMKFIIMTIIMTFFFATAPVYLKVMLYVSFRLVVAALLQSKKKREEIKTVFIFLRYFLALVTPYIAFF